jgi:hypothetical protein
MSNLSINLSDKVVLVRTNSYMEQSITCRNIKFYDRFDIEVKAVHYFPLLETNLLFLDSQATWTVVSPSDIKGMLYAAPFRDEDPRVATTDGYCIGRTPMPGFYSWEKNQVNKVTIHHDEWDYYEKIDFRWEVVALSKPFHYQEGVEFITPSDALDRYNAQKDLLEINKRLRTETNHETIIGLNNWLFKVNTILDRTEVNQL